MLIIDAPHFYAALVINAGIVVRAAPILTYMKGWSKNQVVDYCERKKWKVIFRTPRLPTDR